MKKTLMLLAFLSLGAAVSQAATLWTTTFGNADQTNPTEVSLTNSGGQMNGVTGTVDSLKKELYTGGGAVDCLLKTGGDLAADPSLFTPDVNVQTAGSWTAGMTFTNTGSQACSISSVKMTMISFSGSGITQNFPRSFSLTLTLGGQDVTAIVIVPGGSGNTGTDVTLTFSSPVELGAGEELDFSVFANKGVEVEGAFFGIKSMEFHGELLVPEPATASLGLLGLAALMMRRRRA